MSTKEVISEVVAQTLDAAKGNPDMRLAGVAAGKSVRVLAETVRTALLPFAALNFGVRKFEEYIRTKFADELDEALDGVASENLQEPPLHVAGPVMQGLAYTYESEELRRLYLSLLATSMDSSRDDDAHPAFADVIRQLAPREAQYLEAFLPQNGYVACVQVRHGTEEKFTILHPHLLQVRVDGEPDRHPSLPVYVTNWERLGLIALSFDMQLTDTARYRWGETRPEYLEAVEAFADDSVTHDNGGEEEKVYLRYGLLMPTSWGRAFSNAVRMGDVEAVPETAV